MAYQYIIKKLLLRITYKANIIRHTNIRSRGSNHVRNNTTNVPNGGGRQTLLVTRPVKFCKQTFNDFTREIEETKYVGWRRCYMIKTN